MPNDTVDLWVEDLPIGNSKNDYYWALLDANEQAKALRFIQKKHRHQYITSHSKLRIILAAYLDIEPAAIQYAVEEFGKPYLVNNGIPCAVKFNLSHSGDKMIVAVGCYDYLGVDIEVWDTKTDYLAIAEQCFTDPEKKFCLALVGAQKPEMFYQLWTRKESFAKATGTGITMDVSQVATSCMGSARFLSIPDCYGKADEWALIDLKFDGQLSGALTVKTNALNRINFKTLPI